MTSEEREITGLEQLISSDPIEWSVEPGWPWWKPIGYTYDGEPLTLGNWHAHYYRRVPMSAFQKFIARAKVIFTAAPTYLVAASAIVVIVSSEAATVLPAGAATTVGAVALKIVAVLTAAINIIRRVTPVLPSERGIL